MRAYGTLRQSTGRKRGDRGLGPRARAHGCDMRFVSWRSRHRLADRTTDHGPG